MEYLMEIMSSPGADSMKLCLLKAMTEDFSEKMKIGGGGYGEVYKGVLNGNAIAVKKLFPIFGLDDKAFENEICNLKKVQHKNVIEMIGYCHAISHRNFLYEGKIVWSQVIERVICYEYAKGGSLANHISAKSCIHDWPTTYKIIYGTCEGLDHLHNGGEQRIFHLDLKPANILLDEQLVPKIGDFALSRLFGNSYTHQISGTKGTIGFMPPEYMHNAKVSPKNDVFSLGVLIFYMMAGIEGYGDYMDALHLKNFSHKIQQEFIENVQEYWKMKMQASQGYRWDKTDLLGVRKCIEVAMHCVEVDRDKRPLIREIIGELKELDSKMEEMLKEDPKPLIRQQQDSKMEEMLHEDPKSLIREEDDPRELIIPSKSSITSGPSSWRAEASRSTHSDNYLWATTEAKAMTFKELHRITDGFSEERLLGKGAYGRVYKGVLDNGEVIAVKKLNIQPELVEASFKNELLNLMMAQHQNIIRLVGHCCETQEKVVEHEGKSVVAVEQKIALCLEYMQGGTLEELLSDEVLDWEARYKIIKGICQGLNYLHTGSKNPMYHLDLKPSNILLDKDLIPKIGDFGLSRLLVSTGTFVTQTNSGTCGYMPPEYMHGRKISRKFDVFSLGVIIIQIIAGPEGHYNYRCIYKSDPQEFIDHVTENWSTRMKANSMSTEALLEDLKKKEALLEVQKCIKMAIRCVEDDREKRPTITEIVKELNMIDLGALGAVSRDETTLEALSI